MIDQERETEATLRVATTSPTIVLEAPGSDEGTAVRRHGWASRTRNGAPPVSTIHEVQIPVLPGKKEQGEERKGAGLFWTAASPGAGSGAISAASGTSSLPFGLGRVAAALARRLGAGSLVGRALLSRAGGWLLLGTFLGGGMLAGIVAGLTLHRAAASRKPALALNLDTPRAVILVRGARDKSLPFARGANQGELASEEFRPLAAEPREEVETVKAEPAPWDRPPQRHAEGPADEGGPVDGPATTLEAATTRRLRKLEPMRDALANIRGFGEGVAATDVFNRRPQSRFPSMDKRPGPLAAPARGRRALKASGLRQVRARASRAMGQLKLARFISEQARVLPTGEISSRRATDAFEQSKTQGGDLPGLPAQADAAPRVVVPLGTGAPDLMRAPELVPPPVGPAIDVTPYRPQLDAALNLGRAAGMLRILGLLMMAAGVAMIVLGSTAVPTPNWALIVTGSVMLSTGTMMLAMGLAMAQAAKAIAEQIEKVEGQVEQGMIAADAAQAQANGRAYTPPDLSQKTRRNEGVAQAVDKERNAGFHFEGDGETQDGGAGKGRAFRRGNEP